MPPNPKDSMKSTWRTDRSQWNIAHYLISMLAPSPATLGKPPVFKKTDKVPVFKPWSQDLWIVLHAAWPMLLQHVFAWYMGRNLKPIGAFLLYTAAFQLNSIHEINVIAKLGQKYGYLDGDVHARDDVPDVGVMKAFLALISTTTVRPLFTLIFTYKQAETPLPSVWLPVELVLYALALDFFFYFYHRACHEVDFLWRYHRTHHLTKHPNPFLSAYADSEQEILEIAVIPILAWAVLKFGLDMPMTFYDWWVCHEFVIFSEAIGHSGIRVYSSSPGVARPFLNLLGCELAGEDHDLHHRLGYRKSSNYGKQTRFWDRLFGTTSDRIEMTAMNLDYNNQVGFSLI